jgi:hypothetical protein
MKIEIYSEENRIFLIKEVLAQRNRGKMGIKKYRGDHHEFREFG